MSKKRPGKLLTVLGGSFIISSVLLCSFILFWTYYSAKKAINMEITKSFEQRYNITEGIFEQEAELIDHAIYEIQHETGLLSVLSKKGASDAEKIFNKYVEKHPRSQCDVLFISRADNPVWINASSPVPDVRPILENVADMERRVLKKPAILSFKNGGAEFTGIFKSKKLILSDGEVFGIIIAGTILNKNLKFVNKIKKETDSPVIVLANNNIIIAASSNIQKGVFEDIVNHVAKGDLHYRKRIIGPDRIKLALSHDIIKLAGRPTSIEVLLSIDNSAIVKLNRAYLETLVIILTVFGIFLFATLIAIRRLIYPSIENILEYTKGISMADDSDVLLEPGSIIELNVIGSAMENMVASIRNTQAELKASEKRYRLIADNVADVIWVMDLDLRLIYISPSIYHQRGFTVQEACGQAIEDMVLPHSLEMVTNLYSEKLVRIESGDPEGLESEIFEMELYCKDGSTLWTSTNARILTGADGKPESILGVTCDVSDRILAETALKESEKKYRYLFESSMDAILLLTPQSGYIDCNKAALEMFGVDSKEVLGNLTPADLSPLYQPDGVLSSERAEQNIKTALKEGACFFEWKHKRLNGEDFYASVLATRVKIDGQTLLQGTIRDITEYKRSQEMIVQSEKMLSVGGLAAGMAHEINNPLAGIMQTANVMASRLGDKIDIPANLKAAEAAGTTIESIRSFMESRGILRMINTINESGHRVGDIVNNMLSFSRKSEAVVSSQDPVELMDKTLELAATDYDLKKQYDFKIIEIIKEYDSDLPMVLCERAKIQQVLLNILRNGAQALQSKKTTDGDENHRFIVRLKVDKLLNMLRVEIEDNGPGMDDKIRKRIFEPFFTTKPAGIGTGLGLSVSYFIVTENHKGTMDVISETGKGTTFIICLPLEKQENA